MPFAKTCVGTMSLGYLIIAGVRKLENLGIVLPYNDTAATDGSL